MAGYRKRYNKKMRTYEPKRAKAKNYNENERLYGLVVGIPFEHARGATRSMAQDVYATRRAKVSMARKRTRTERNRQRGGAQSRVRSTMRRWF